MKAWEWIKANITKISGWLTTVVATIQVSSARTILFTDGQFEVFVLGMGLFISFLGMFNSGQATVAAAVRKIDEAVSKQSGFARVAFLALCIGLALGGLGLASCTGTKAAYQAAQDVDDTAFVVTRHYGSILREAADLKDSGALSGRPLEALRDAEQIATPIVIGDEATGQPGLRELARIYTDAKAAYDEAVNAETTAALDAANAKLSQAVNDAMRAVAGFLRALEAARSATSQVQPLEVSPVLAGVGV